VREALVEASLVTDTWAPHTERQTLSQRNRGNWREETAVKEREQKVEDREKTVAASFYPLQSCLHLLQSLGGRRRRQGRG